MTPTHRIKCNRELPCQNCIVRNEVRTCSYVAPPVSSRCWKQTVRNRQGKDSSQSTEVPALTAAGAIFNDQYDTYYRGVTHWGSVVDEVGIFSAPSTKSTIDADRRKITGPDLAAVTLGSSSNGSESSKVSREITQDTRESALESIVELPLRAVADRLVLSFFDTQGPTGLWLRILLLHRHAVFSRLMDLRCRSPSNLSI